jgi:hypothetical protein
LCRVLTGVSSAISLSHSWSIQEQLDTELSCTPRSIVTDIHPAADHSNEPHYPQSPQEEVRLDQLGIDGPKSETTSMFAPYWEYLEKINESPIAVAH